MANRNKHDTPIKDIIHNDISYDDINIRNAYKSLAIAVLKTACSDLRKKAYSSIKSVIDDEAIAMYSGIIGYEEHEVRDVLEDCRQYGIERCRIKGDCIA